MANSNELRFPVLCFSEGKLRFFAKNAGKIGFGNPSLYGRGRFYKMLEVVDCSGARFKVAEDTIVWPRSRWARALASLFDVPFQVSLRFERLGGAMLDDIKKIVIAAIEEDPEGFEEATGHDLGWWVQALNRTTSFQEFFGVLEEHGMAG